MVAKKYFTGLLIEVFGFNPAFLYFYYKVIYELSYKINRAL